MSLEPCPRALIGGTLIDGTGRPPIEDSVVVIKGDWISSVGIKGKVEIPAGAEIIDVSGKTVMPGLIDAHTHFFRMGVAIVQLVDLSETYSINEALSLVKKRVSSVKKGEWIIGRGWDESKWKEKRYIVKDDLDPFTQDNPVMLSRICGHLITLNSKALSIAEITKNTPDPPRGKIDRGQDGEPTGILRDARHLVERVLPPVTEELALEGLKQACRKALSLGCTGIHDAGLTPQDIRFYQKAYEKGLLSIRAYLMMHDEASEAAFKLGVYTGFGNDFLKIGSIKLLIDGSMGARTAALFEPYSDDPSTKGLLLIPPEELNMKVKKAHNNMFQVAIHAIGDRGIELAINAIEEALKENPRKNHRHRIEHCEVLSSAQIERIKSLGIVASMQPNFVGEWSQLGGMYEARIGPKRLRQNNPYRAMLDEGVKLSFGSDCMPFNPIYGIHSAVNHPIKESRISLVEAVKGFTLDAAYSAFEEHIKGSIEPGKLADITIFEGDLTKISAEKIKDAKVYMTIVNGKILYCKD
ncbi:amidohydrolase [Candidatus Bathyarchaeota archaeon]|nr:amidohydrolase [Candidatus Bathyarchaeota archaeon]MBS7630488.1 amidohydrolase [Candidatus Bathyarchaeota archaeon]